MSEYLYESILIMLQFMRGAWILFAIIFGLIFLMAMILAAYSAMIKAEKITYKLGR